MHTRSNSSLVDNDILSAYSFTFMFAGCFYVVVAQNDQNKMSIININI